MIHVVDRGFTTADELKALNVELNIPAFLSGSDQLTQVEVNRICAYKCGTGYSKNKNISINWKRNSTYFPWFNKSVIDCDPLIL